MNSSQETGLVVVLEVVDVDRMEARPRVSGREQEGENRVERKGSRELLSRVRDAPRLCMCELINF